MRSARLDRVYRQSLSASHFLARCAQEAEQLVDQALADDLWELAHKLQAVVKAAEQNHYRSPSRRYP